MELNFKILPPEIPDHIVIDRKMVVTRQEGFKPDDKSNQIPLKELTKEQADEYAELMKNTFLEKWKQATA